MQPDQANIFTTWPLIWNNLYISGLKTKHRTKPRCAFSCSSRHHTLFLNSPDLLLSHIVSVLILCYLVFVFSLPFANPNISQKKSAVQIQSKRKQKWNMDLETSRRVVSDTVKICVRIIGGQYYLSCRMC